MAVPFPSGPTDENITRNPATAQIARPLSDAIPMVATIHASRRACLSEPQERSLRDKQPVALAILLFEYSQIRPRFHCGDAWLRSQRIGDRDQLLR